MQGLFFVVFRFFLWYNSYDQKADRSRSMNERELFEKTNSRALSGAYYFAGSE